MADVEIHQNKHLNHAEVLDADAIYLASIGKNEQLKRKFTFWSVLGISVCVSGTWEGVLGALSQALSHGGTSSLVWGFLVTAICSACVACSLAELASIWPTSGAQYHWSAELSPPRIRPAVSWFSGWLTLACSWLGLVSCAFAVAVQLQAYVQVARPDYDPQRWHVSMIYWACSAAYCIINIYLVKYLHWMNIAVICIHLIGYAAVLITLLVCATPKHGAAYVFTVIVNESGWDNNGIAWCIGLLSSLNGFIAIEAAAHYSEELKNAARDLPKAMVYSVIANGIITFPFMIIVAFCLGDLDSLLSGPLALSSPSTQIFLDVTGSVAASIFLNAFSTLAAFDAGIDIMGSCSRSVWAMARDRAFPSWVAQIDKKWDAPVNATIVIAVPQFLIGLIYIWNSTAFYGVIAGVLVAYQGSWLLPISLHLFYGRRNLDLKYGPWNMGRFGWMVDVVSVSWTAFVIVVMSLPTYIPVTAANMNYAVIILAFIFFISVILWFSYARSKYTGPVMDPEVLMGQSIKEEIETYPEASNLFGKGTTNKQTKP